MMMEKKKESFFFKILLNIAKQNKNKTNTYPWTNKNFKFKTQTYKKDENKKNIDDNNAFAKI